MYRLLAGLATAALLVACTSAEPTRPLPAPPGQIIASTYSAPPPALAADSPTPRLYVAPTGDDAGPGTEEAPFLTIKHASEVAQPGTAVIVANGTYTGRFKTEVSGTEGARITFVSRTKWGAKLVAERGDKTDDAVWRNYGDYIDIQGFDISGTTTDGLIETGSYGRIIENTVYGFTEGCISTYESDYALHDIDIIGNVVHNCGTTSEHHGIYPGHPGGTISNNIAYNNPGFGIHCWHNCNRMTISNNLVFGNGQGGILVGQGDNPNDGNVPADGMVVTNNIAYDNGGDEGIRESGATGPNNVFLNNNVAGNAEPGIGLITGQESGTISSEPEFLNFRPDGSGDYRLLSTSPDVDAGTTTGAPGTDIVGGVRPQGKGIDIGVFEQ
jgi:hypothetical protein